MSNWPYTEEELDRYFKSPEARHGLRSNGNGRTGPPRRGIAGYFHRRFRDTRKAQAAMALSAIAGLLLAVTLFLSFYTVLIWDELPSLQQLENPHFQLASVAYTADGRELARYARQNRTWVAFEDISPHVINALIATEDHRFYENWGIDLFRTVVSVAKTLLGDRQGGSTISQQLARNLYNEQIGRRVTIERKLKEMITAIELERRYTKREILEMYLNTVEFGYNAYGIEAAARTFYGTSPMELDPLQSATLIGMLKGTTIYNPVTRPENARQRRNVVLRLMVEHGHLSEDYYLAHRDEPVGARYHSAAITNSLAPHFARYVGERVEAWARQHGHDLYTDGLVIYTTLDARLQELATQAVLTQMEGLQAVVDYEWSRPSGYSLGLDVEPYLAKKGTFEPFAHFWSSQKELVDQFIRETPRFAALRRSGLGPAAALDSLRRNRAFMDSLKTNKTRLEAGLVALDPRTGHVKAWVGGRKMEEDWNDHVAQTRRQPGSTFKPFVYTAAIHNGWSPYYTLPDSTFEYVDAAGNVWSPKNTGGSTGEMMTLRQGLARSLNTITARLMLEIGPPEVAFFARRMGIKSPLDEVPALALGTSDVTLLELTAAYGTLANGGLYHEPVVITRIEDRNGNVLFEAEPAPQEALSEATAYTMVDMLRAVIQEGTGIRIRTQFGLGEYDLAGKTGTTQNSADGWFVLMHPELVTGAWVGFNDRRIAFRSNYWGQGAHNALFLVGDFFRRATRAGDLVSKTRFPAPEEFGLPVPQPERHRDRDRISW
ncbi:PBP1A family penicillin-binding protein [Rhodocaloribacter litoris]|uniref:penicillin-binding protein 1A n=1 Tax=Rhodocaloribacter litoris TaxID=2558931 RepID=UPI0014227FCF|nr:PBP1A family penicillin-binding protein [Rhodocaloribacter litoris]QXD15876.1 PBP1A family penicillin-binding protein [Rhodocaloribacter litoris]